MNKPIIKLITFTTTILTTLLAHANIPLLSINLVSPIPLPTELAITDTLIVTYNVTNNTNFDFNFTMLPIDGVTVSGTTFMLDHQPLLNFVPCTIPFNLAPGASCELTLNIDGEFIPNLINGGPVICKTLNNTEPTIIPNNPIPNRFLCAQPNTSAEILNISKCETNIGLTSLLPACQIPI